MRTEDEFQAEDLDDEKTIEFIKNYLPQEMKSRFTDDDLYFILDTIDEYFTSSDILEPSSDDSEDIDIDLTKIVDYVLAECKHHHMGDWTDEEIFFVVQGEMEYADQFWAEDDLPGDSEK